MSQGILEANLKKETENCSLANDKLGNCPLMIASVNIQISH